MVPDRVGVSGWEERPVVTGDAAATFVGDTSYHVAAPGPTGGGWRLWGPEAAPAEVEQTRLLSAVAPPLDELVPVMEEASPLILAGTPEAVLLTADELRLVDEADAAGCAEVRISVTDPTRVAQRVPGERWEHFDCSGASTPRIGASGESTWLAGYSREDTLYWIDWARPQGPGGSTVLNPVHDEVEGSDYPPTAYSTATGTFFLLEESVDVVHAAAVGAVE